MQGVTAPVIDGYLNDSLRYYKYHRFWFNETAETIVLNQDDPVVPNVPTDFLQEIERGGLSIVYSQVTYPLNKVASEVYDSWNISALGLPALYTYRNEQFEVYPFPNTTYSLIFRYLKDYADLVNDNDSNDFTTLADRVLLYDALSRIYAEYKQDPNMEAYFTARAANEEKNLLKRSSALSGSGTLTTDSVLFQ